jgi:hypothetical protein
MKSIDEATVILIVSQSIMFLVFFLAEHFKKNTPYVGAGILVGTTIPLIIVGFMKSSVYGVLPAVFIAVPAFLLTALYIVVREKARSEG